MVTDMKIVTNSVDNKERAPGKFLGSWKSSPSLSEEDSQTIIL